jgi:dethiobiotin synthetase
MSRPIFVTGTDSGVGKTLLTGLLLYHLRETGCHALAMKPFCSGGRGDARFLRRIAGRELSLDQINPWHFAEPLAPLVAARRHHRHVCLRDVIEAVQGVAATCQCLLVEGAGGLLVPLGEGYTVADLIGRLQCAVVVVSANRLGTINHTLLTVEGLRDAGATRIKVVLMQRAHPDASSRTNAAVLAELLGPVPLFAIGYLGPNPRSREALKKNQKKFQKVLARLLW